MGQVSNHGGDGSVTISQVQSPPLFRLFTKDGEISTRTGELHPWTPERCAHDLITGEKIPYLWSRSGWFRTDTSLEVGQELTLTCETEQQEFRIVLQQGYRDREKGDAWEFVSSSAPCILADCQPSHIIGEKQS